MALGLGVGAVARRGVDAAGAGAAVERRVSGRAARLAPEDEGAEVLERVAEREGVAVGGGGGAAAAL